jgi:alpha-mannosidase
LARKVSMHAGTLPRHWGLLDISAPNVVASALMPGRDGSVTLRIYEASGKPATGAEIKVHNPVVSAEETNLLGDDIRALPVAQDTLHLDLRPFEIKTIKLKLGSPGASK